MDAWSFRLDGHAGHTSGADLGDGQADGWAAAAQWRGDVTELSSSSAHRSAGRKQATLSVTVAAATVPGLDVGHPSETAFRCGLLAGR